jgi:hypothetical protein
MPLPFSNLSSPATSGFRGSKHPKPPAITTTCAFILVPKLVVSSKSLSPFFSKLSILSPKVNPGLNGSICSSNLSTNSCARIEG